MAGFRFTDQFSLRVAYNAINADIDVGKTTVSPEAGGPNSVRAITIAFTYTTGKPAATAFQMAWPAITPQGSPPANVVVTPATPAGEGAEVRSGTVTCTVAPAVTTIYTGRMTIVQA